MKSITLNENKQPLSSNLTDPNEYPWQPATPRFIAETFMAAKFDWWFAGGFAIEFFVGQRFRSHDDIDIVIRSNDVKKLHAALPGWQLYASTPDSQLRLWPPNSILSNPVKNLWCRAPDSKSWNLQIMVNDCITEDGIEKFVYKRNSQITFAIDHVTTSTYDGWPCLRPELQLIYKAKNIRKKDEMDFQKAWPKLSKSSQNWLVDQIRLCYGESHPWIDESIASRFF